MTAEQPNNRAQTNEVHGPDAVDAVSEDSKQTKRGSAIVGKTAQRVAGATQQAAGATKDWAVGAGTALQERAGALGSAAASTTGATVATVKQTTGQAKTAIAGATSAAAGQLAKTATSATQSGRDVGIAAGQRVTTSTTQMHGMLQDRIGNYPIPVLVGAFVVGVILGRVV
jgi:hypothetical protein